jgi:hypothetical protein
LGQKLLVKPSKLTRKLNRNFTLEYLFPELGAYQVIMRTNSTNLSSIALASFNVSVTLDSSFLNTVITGIVILVIFCGVGYLVTTVKKKLRKKYH